MLLLRQCLALQHERPQWSLFDNQLEVRALYAAQGFSEQVLQRAAALGLTSFRFAEAVLGVTHA